jgi:hypothetical protein
MAGDDRLLQGEEPFILKRVSLTDAATMFDPSKNRKAVEMLVNRGRLRVWPQKNEEDTTIALWTTREWLEEFVNSGPRAGKLKAPQPIPDDRDRQIAVLRQVVLAQSSEISRLRMEVATLKVDAGWEILGEIDDSLPQNLAPAEANDPGMA